eukprot:TRINITY_DN67378_c0_g1_i1.p1 TRINITY_DN67378_c0_g1~~TRINITY_DN67378_c0_g1_i1.p1  ORF type:complete len:355 (+),score=85.50 TRINITY_DN67378_c0_g1_i1:163-1227(+)
MPALAAAAMDNHPLVLQVRRVILKRWGNGGIRALVKSFAAHGDQLNADQFQAALHLAGLRLTPDEFQQLARLFDVNADGTVSLTEFYRAIRGGLNQRRQLLVDQVFHKFDLNSSGCVDVQDLRGRYDASRHPAVVQGRRTEAQVLEEFLRIFDQPSAPDGVVTLEEFRDYYAGISANVENDDEFEFIVTAAWDFRSPEQRREAQQQAKAARAATHLGQHPLSPNGTRRAPNASNQFFAGTQQLQSAKFSQGAASAFADDSAFFSDAKVLVERVPTPKRVLGYTGHVPLAQLAVGESYSASERAASMLQETWAVKRPPPAPQYESPADVPQMRFAQRPGYDRLGRSSNTTTFKLE